jgi:hypothetical protein
MALDAVSPLNRLVAVLQALPGMEAVYVGVPESLSGRVGAYVALGGSDAVDEATNLLQRRLRYFVAFAYAVEGHEETAEAAVAGFVDGFQTALLQERATRMGGLVDSVEWNFALGDSPEYQPIAEREYRVLPVVVTVTQHATF